MNAGTSWPRALRRRVSGGWMRWLPLLLPLVAAADESCKVDVRAILPVVMEDAAPVLDAKINGKDVRFILDSGAFYSMISEPMARSLDLKVTVGSPYGANWMRGVGGSVALQSTKASEFEFAGIKAKNIEFLVGGSALQGRGLLGNNLLGSWDVEYDLAHGRVSLLHITGCQNANLAYWKTPEQSYSVMEFSSRSGRENSFNQVIGLVYLNDQRMRAMLDTGAHATVVTLEAAARAGVRVSSPGVRPASTLSGIGQGGSKSWQAPFGSVKLGNNEEIKNTRVRIGDITLGEMDLALGADFFLSHHVLVSRALQKVFFTYNGGPVFNIGKGDDAAPVAAADSDADAGAADAESLVRRAAASMSRHDYGAARADLDKAIALDATQPEYYYRRAEIAMARDQPADAVPDFDAALKLRADFMPALMPRAEAKMALHDDAAAIADLDTFDRLAGRQAFERLSLGDDYLRARAYPAAIRQFNTWIDEYPQDGSRVHALGRRCLARALGNTDLEQAMSDCNHALSIVDRQFKQFRTIYAARGLVWLRQRNYDKSLSDFEAALKEDTKNPFALYGRSVVRTRKGLDGAGDLAAAREASADTVEQLVAAGF